MTRRTTMLVAGLLLLLLPPLYPLVAGFVDLAQGGRLLPWALAYAICCVAAWLLWERATVFSSAMPGPDAGELEIGPEPFWTPADMAVWLEIKQISHAVLEGQREIRSLEQLRAVGDEMMQLVARAYHPQSRDPRLEVTLTHLLLVNEQASRDLRKLFVEYIPFHDVLTLGDTLRARRTFSAGSVAFNFYRALRTVGSPLTALFGELRGLATKRAMRQVGSNTSRWVLARMIECGGKHLINLYSGQVVDTVGFGEFARGAAPAESAIPEQGVLRILLFGQTGAGKSSTINALFGELRSEAGHLPSTRELLRFEKELPGIGTAVIVDSPGYGDSEERSDVLDTLAREAREADLLLLVTPALGAARALDLEALQRLRGAHDGASEEPTAPLIVVLTKIDRLPPFTSWQPPYDLSNPLAHPEDGRREKAAHIRDAVLQVSTELELEPELIVPISVRTPEEQYNIEALVTVMGELLPLARRRLLRRMLKEYREEQYWETLRRSMKKSGRIVLRRGFDAAITGVRGIATYLDRPQKK